MNSWTFFASLLAINIVFHLLRLPHLILENGGGAFVMLFITVLHVIALPLILTEIQLSRAREKSALKEVLAIRKVSGNSLISQGVFCAVNLLQVVLLFFLSCFFIFMIGLSCLHIFEFASLSLNGRESFFTQTDYPAMGYSLFAISLLIFMSYKIVKSYFNLFVKLSARWVLPFCFSIFVLVFVKILLSLTSFEGVKTLFYPDFSQLKSDSLLLAIGQSLVCLFVGLNFFGQPLLMNKKKDPIRLVIHGVIQSICITLFVGVFALPTVQQSSESIYGASWIFELFPRWLSYSAHGYYYCFLFYVSLSFIFLYLLIITMNNTWSQFKKIFNIRRAEEKISIVLGIVVAVGITLFYGQSLKAWWGQGVYLFADRVFVNFLLPLFCCGMIWMMFKETKKESRQELFRHQQVFFHNIYFFKSWEFIVKYVVPGLILLSWLLLFFKE